MNKMNKPSLEQVEHMISNKPASSPDFDTMWASIEQEVLERQHTTPAYDRKPSLKRRLIPTTAAAAICLLIAVPVFAAVNSNWDLFGRSGVNNAIHSGFGQKLDESVKSAGATMNLHGVVTDGSQMDVLFTMDVPNIPDYDAVVFEKQSLTGSKDSQAKPYVMMQTDKETGSLKGMFELEDKLQQSRQNFSLNASGLIFYKYNDLPLQGAINEGAAFTLPASVQQQYTGVKIQSIIREKDKVSLRYNISSPLQNPRQNDPNLFITSGSETFKPVYSAVLPKEGSNMLSQQSFNIPEEEWNNAQLHFTYLQETQKVDGTWAFDFEADGKKASEVMYSKELKLEDPAADTIGMKLNQLLVTPLQIRIPYEEINTDWKQGYVYFKTVKLLLGQHEIEGGRYGMKGVYLRFESPEWFKDWSNVPMKLVFSDLQINKRDTSKNWFALSNPSSTKQHLEMNLDGRKVDFTYYKEGKDLMVTSKSDDPTFYGIAQSTLDVNGENVFPKANQSPPSSGIVTKIERYPNVPDGATLKLNPGSYTVLEPSRIVEVPIN